MAEILGRAWFYDTGDPFEVEVWHHSLDPTTDGRRSVGEWAYEHFHECYDEAGLRELLGVPKEGAFQVLFRGDIDGAMSGFEVQEWDEWFDVAEVVIEHIPAEYQRTRLGG